MSTNRKNKENKGIILSTRVYVGGEGWRTICSYRQFLFIQEPNQPLLRILNLSNTTVSIFPEVEEFLVMLYSFGLHAFWLFIIKSLRNLFAEIFWDFLMRDLRTDHESF